MEMSTSQEHSRFQVFTALKSPGFRRYWLGSLASVLGFQIMIVAQGWLIYEITDSKLYLGYAGLAAGLPAIVLNLFGGVVADKVDQRRLLMVTQTTSGLVMFALAAWDSRGQKLLLARDPFGIKPLFLLEHDGCFWFRQWLHLLRRPSRGLRRRMNVRTLLG